jgi:hypothetical protein
MNVMNVLCRKVLVEKTDLSAIEKGKYGRIPFRLCYRLCLEMQSSALSGDFSSLKYLEKKGGGVIKRHVLA